MAEQVETLTRFEELEMLLEGETDISGAIRDTFVLRGINQEIRRLRFTYGGAIGVDLRQATNRPDDRDVIVTLSSGSRYLGLGLRHADGFMSFQAGGMFAILPSGDFSNRFGLSGDCDEHGSLTEETEQELVNIALGRLTISFTREP